tara:strand:+ start:165 stop:932 length:768 start_codon:yes stop_codon:yes gene_type:complete
MSDLKKFSQECKKRINKFNNQSKIFKKALEFFEISHKEKYTYNFNWLGVPVIQFPQDILLMQEIIYETKPNIIIETGVARGGSLIMYSSLLSLIQKEFLIVGIDVDIRKHNRNKIKRHLFSTNINLIQGDSIAESTIRKLETVLKSSKIKKKKIMVCLDSNHTHDHVFQELKKYCKFVSKNCYLVVFDTTLNLLPPNKFKSLTKDYLFEPFGKSSNPHTAVKAFMLNNKYFEIDSSYHKKALITNCYDGFIKRVK